MKKKALNEGLTYGLEVPARSAPKLFPMKAFVLEKNEFQKRLFLAIKFPRATTTRHNFSKFFGNQTFIFTIFFIQFNKSSIAGTVIRCIRRGITFSSRWVFVPLGFYPSDFFVAGSLRSSTRLAFAIWMIPNRSLFCCYTLAVLCFVAYVNLTMHDVLATPGWC